MTTTTTTNRIAYTGDGSTVDFSFPYYTEDETDLLVVLRAADGTEAEQVLDTDYTVSGTGSSSVFVHMDTAPAAATVSDPAERLVIVRREPLNQEVEADQLGSFRSKAFEEQLDRHARQAQRVYDQADRSLRIAETDLNDGNSVWQAQDRRITGVADPVDDSDAVNKTWVENLESWSTVALNAAVDAAEDAAADAAASAVTASDAEAGASAAEAAAESSQSAAASSASAAASSAASALSSKDSAATSATNAATSASAASDSEDNAAEYEDAAYDSYSAVVASETIAVSAANAAAASAVEAAESAGSIGDAEANAAASAAAAAASAVTAGNAEDGAQAAASNAASSANAAATSASAASNSAGDAIDAATAAAGSATTATAQATAAAASASAASDSEDNAAEYEDAAYDSYSAAIASETVAVSAANAASTSATAASSSANNAAEYEDAAYDSYSAVVASETVAVSAANAAESDAAEASNSATAAAGSASDAEDSADAAAASATSASGSATAASDSADNAAEYEDAAYDSYSAAVASETIAVSAANAAESSATEANNSATAAAGSATAAAGSATAASNSATSAGNSATAAAGSASDAEDSADEAAAIASAISAAITQPSRAYAISSYHPDTAPSFIQTAGYAAAGDGGDALYSLVTSEPTHGGKLSITLSDAVTVKWYEIAESGIITLKSFGVVGDGVTDDTAAFQSMQTYVEQVNGLNGVGLTILFQGCNVGVSETIVFDTYWDNVVLSGASFTAVGTWTQITSASPTGTWDNTLAGAMWTYFDTYEQVTADGKTWALFPPIIAIVGYCARFTIDIRYINGARKSSGIFVEGNSKNRVLMNGLVERCRAFQLYIHDASTIKLLNTRMRADNEGLGDRDSYGVVYDGLDTHWVSFSITWSYCCLLTTGGTLFMTDGDLVNGSNDPSNPIDCHSWENWGGTITWQGGRLGNGRIWTTNTDMTFLGTKIGYTESNSSPVLFEFVAVEADQKFEKFTFMPSETPYEITSGTVKFATFSAVSGANWRMTTTQAEALYSYVQFTPTTLQIVANLETTEVPVEFVSFDTRCRIRFQDADNYNLDKPYLGSEGEDLIVGTNGSDRWRFVNNGVLRPEAAGTNLASSSNRIGTIYLQNAPDVPSDISLKMDVSAIPASELQAAKIINGLIRRYRMKSAPTCWHYGVVAQEARDALSRVGLSADDYAWLRCGDDGLLSVAYDELQMLLLASLHRKRWSWITAVVDRIMAPLRRLFYGENHGSV